MRLACIPLGATLFLATTVEAGDLRVQGKFVSEAASGPPLTVSSSERVSNLNADLLDGMTSAEFAGVTELATPGSGVTVHWKNLTGIPGRQINQTCAVKTGCFDGDSAGWPVTIVNSGSYRVTSNLNVTTNKGTGGENNTAIVITTGQSTNPRVFLDLGGFTIQGPATCTGTPATSCSPTGSGRGIEVAADIGMVDIRNGLIAGLGNSAIFCQSLACRIQNIQASENGDDGIFLLQGSISESTAHRNGGDGISLYSGLVDGCVATSNKESGIILSNGQVTESRGYGNGNAGIAALGATSIINNTVSDNLKDGLVAGNGSTVINNTASDNQGAGIFAKEGTVSRNTARSNGGDGVLCDECNLIENTAVRNDGFGISATGVDGAYGDNLIADNVAGTVTGTLYDRGGNVCEGAPC